MLELDMRLDARREQLRREAEGRAEERILPAQSETPSVREYDAFTLELLKKITNYRVYSA